MDVPIDSNIDLHLVIVGHEVTVNVSVSPAIDEILLEVVSQWPINAYGTLLRDCAYQRSAGSCTTACISGMRPGGHTGQGPGPSSEEQTMP